MSTVLEQALAFIKAINTDANYDFDGNFKHWDEYDVDALIADLEAVVAKEKAA